MKYPERPMVPLPQRARSTPGYMNPRDMEMLQPIPSQSEPASSNAAPSGDSQMFEDPGANIVAGTDGMEEGEIIDQEHRERDSRDQESEMMDYLNLPDQSSSK